MEETLKKLETLASVTADISEIIGHQSKETRERIDPILEQFVSELEAKLKVMNDDVTKIEEAIADASK